jgi:hypothetical protein
MCEYSSPKGDEEGRDMSHILTAGVLNLKGGVGKSNRNKK